MFVNIIFVRCGLLRGHPVDNMTIYYLSSFPVFFLFVFFFFFFFLFVFLGGVL